MKSVIKWCSYFFIFIISTFLRWFVKTNNNLLVFGCRGGLGYEGNTKYLFIYGNKYTDYECVFITKNKKIYNKLTKQGFIVYNYYSLKAIYTVLKAKCIYITHGLLDIPPVWLNKNTELINTWHGIPIKKISFCDKNLKFYKRIMDYIRDVRTDVFISNSENFNKFYNQCFRINVKNLRVLGLARINFLVNSKNFFSLKKENNKKIYLYAPTFRDYEIEYDFFKKEHLARFQKFLEKHDYELWIKLHPFVIKNIDLLKYKNIKIIETNEDVYELLPLVNVLISDYSSIIIDFLVAYPNKEILLYCFDLDKYKKERGFLFNFEEKFNDVIYKKFDKLFQRIYDNNIESKIDRDYFYNIALVGKECKLHFESIKKDF